MPYPVRPRALKWSRGGTLARISRPRKWSGRQDLNLRILSLPKRALYQTELRPDTLVFIPSEVNGGLSAMAVCTTNYAFCHLRFYPLPACAPTYQITDVRRLGSGRVIEIEHPDIAFTAIYAGMFFEVSRHQYTIALFVSPRIYTSPTVVKLEVSQIVGTTVNALTFSAIGTRIRSFRAFCKCIERQYFLAHRPSLHAMIIACVTATWMAI